MEKLISGCKNMKKYFTICKVSFMGALVHRFHYLAMFLTNIAYIVMIHFLWSAIYNSNSSVTSIMDFKSTFIYLSISSSIYYIFQSWIEYDLSAAMINGNVAVDLIKPYDLQLYWIFRIIGFVLCKILTIGIPSIIVILIMLKGEFPVSINILYTIISLSISFFISVNIDYIAGIIAFYTQSVWGISLVKETFILVLSGMSVPIAFFPSAIGNVIKYLPFSAIYNTPMTILTDMTISHNEVIILILVQAFWGITMFLVTKLIYRQCLAKTIINGG